MLCKQFIKLIKRPTFYMGLEARKSVFRVCNQPAHPRRLINTFFIRFLKSIISKLALRKISIFSLVSVTEETGLSLALSETPKTGFLASQPI